MDLRSRLRRLEEMEMQLGDLYAWFSDALSHDADLAGAFFRLSRQEYSHATMIAFQRRLFRDNPEAHTAAIEGSIDIEIETALRHISEFRENNPSPGAVQALAFAAMIETFAAENIHNKLASSADPEMDRLFVALGNDDRKQRSIVKDLNFRRTEMASVSINEFNRPMKLSATQSSPPTPPQTSFQDTQ